MRIRTNQAGFSHVELVILVVVIAVISFVGFTVYNRQQTKPTDNTSQPVAGNSSQGTDSVASAPDINSASDLDKASAALDQTDPSASNTTDSNQLDSQLANF